MKIKFWGTRGSVPTPGKRTVRYGGNTPCVEVRLDDGNLIIFDAGTGIRELGEQLVAEGKPVNAYLLITHPHWDHIQGFPFFKPIFSPGHTITIVGAESEKVSLERMMTDQMNKVYFPIQLSELQAKLNFQRVGEEEFKVFSASVQTLYVNHPSFALGYRLSHNGRTIVYISDNEPFDPKNKAMQKNLDTFVLERFLSMDGDPNSRVFDFVRGADVLIHDTTYTPKEYSEHIGWGHSHYDFTLKVADEGKVKKLALFHHDPAHSDDEIDRVLEACRNEMRSKKISIECVAAAEGMEIEIP